MQYQGTLLVDVEEAEELEKFCQSPPGVDNCYGKGRPLFDEEYTFPNGMRVAIQVVPSENPNEESCWTQGVLFSPEGVELSCTDVGESFLGDYHLPNGEDEYLVTVKSRY